MPAAPGLTLDGAPIYSRYVRLTHEQWENTVCDLLQLPGVARAIGHVHWRFLFGSNFSNNERRLFMTSGLWSDDETAAETLSQQVSRDATALSRVTGGTTVAAMFIRNFGRRATGAISIAAEETTDGTLFSSGATIFGAAATRSRTAFSWSSRRCCSRRTSSIASRRATGQPLAGYEAATSCCTSCGTRCRTTRSWTPRRPAA